MPKVLITKDSNHCTWYYGMKGKVLPVTHTRNNNYFVPDDFLPVEQAALGPCGVHVPDGELLYTEAEYEEMRQRWIKACDDRDVAKNAGELACNEARKFEKKFTALEEAHDKQVGIWRKRIDSLEAEKQVLLQQIERTIDDKVGLPREVATAIDWYKHHWRGVLTDIEWMRDRSNGFGNDRAVSIIRFYDESEANRMKYLSALVNGYINEETPRERAIDFLINSGAIAKGFSAHDVVDAIADILEKS